MPPQHAYNIPSDSDESITSENIPLAKYKTLKSRKRYEKDTQGDPSIQIENSPPNVTKISPKQVPKPKKEESLEFSTEDNIPLARLRKRLRKETNNEQKFTNKKIMRPVHKILLNKLPKFKMRIIPHPVDTI